MVPVLRTRHTPVGRGRTRGRRAGAQVPAKYFKFLYF